MTSDITDAGELMANPIVAGLVTTIGNGTETPPLPTIDPGDVAPPTQRWLWYEVRQPVITAVDHAAGVMAWRDGGPQELPDVKSQVLATGIPPGDTLNLWFSWQSHTGDVWPTTGTQEIWVATSVLVLTP